jgi:hypothetical protein
MDWNMADEAFTVDTLLGGRVTLLQPARSGGEPRSQVAVGLSSRLLPSVAVSLDIGFRCGRRYC